MSQPYETIDIFGHSLQNNLLDEKVERQALVYLPKNYQQKKEQRYPTLYVLHGFGGLAQGWFSNQHPDPTLHLTMEKLVNDKLIDDMIVVVPIFDSSFTCAGYDNNNIQGNWLDYICIDLLNSIDNKYRTINNEFHRGLIGHSSGASGALRLALKKPGYFNQVFAMSGASTTINDTQGLKELFQGQQDELTQNLPASENSILSHLLINYFQRALPNPNHPPLFCDLPTSEEDWQQIEYISVESLLDSNSNNFADINIALDCGLKEPSYHATKELFYKIKIINNNATWFDFNGGHCDHMGKSLEYVIGWMHKCISNQAIQK